MEDQICYYEQKVDCFLVSENVINGENTAFENGGISLDLHR
jgi:hypothetical protein